jgi:prepilin-type N-terminal cleavage/methylation domain-containing protein
MGISRQERRAGFTLLELLMVVVIIAILASIALPQYIRAAEKARATEALTALGSIRQAEFRYKALSPTNSYTDVLAQLDVQIGNAAGDLTSWNTLVITAAGGGAAAATGNAIYARSGGNFGGQTVGISFGTGTICGTFVPLGLAAAACPNN